MNLFGQATVEPRLPASGRKLTIGLLNNTSDRALASTERHFRSVLRAASPAVEPRLELFTSPEVARSRSPAGQSDEPYGTLEDLFDTRPDALIVTGMEPQAKALRDEPVWNSLTQVADWAMARGVPVVWSCLAAHAVILHLDGIARIPLPEKMSGAFACDVLLGNDGLTTGLPPRWIVPHSRYHGLPERSLASSGYQILSRSDEAGVDMFFKHTGAPFLFFQGHPEYEADTLLLEYRRDVRRYLTGERDDYPAPPRNCLDIKTMAALGRMRESAARNGRGAGDLDTVSRLVRRDPIPSPWQPGAVRLFANWLALIERADLQPCLQPPSADNAAIHP